MSVDPDLPQSFRLVAYETLTEHGFALPCFGRFVGGNTVYAARSSHPGDPIAFITGFDVHEPEDLKQIPVGKQVSEVRVGEPWLDVFLWGDEVYVGTKPEIWRSTSNVRKAIAALAPLSLLSLAEGVRGLGIAEFARAAYEWLAGRENAAAALDWQIDTYFRGLAIRSLRRRLGEAAYSDRVRLTLRDVKLYLQDSTLHLHLPSTLPNMSQITATDLYDCARASHEFGFRLVITRDNLSNHSVDGRSVTAGKILLMRLRQGRGGTQTQIPFAVTDSFFGDEIRVRDLRSGKTRAMTLSVSGNRRNTMKLQLPEIAEMNDPVARFERQADGITYEVYDASTAKGRSVIRLLNAGLRDGTTHQTRGAATRWRVL